MPKVTQEHRDAVRLRLLEAARACLTRTGYEATTTRDILAEAGLSPGTLYNYFSSKEDLIETLSEEVLQADLFEFNAGRRDRGDVGPMLIRLLSDFVFGRPGEGTPVLAQLRGRVHPDPDIRAAVARFNRFIVDSFRPLVEEALEDGFFQIDVDVDALIELIDIVWDGMTRRAAAESFVTSFQRVGAACLQLLLDATTAEPATTERGRR